VEDTIGAVIAHLGWVLHALEIPSVPEGRQTAIAELTKAAAAARQLDPDLAKRLDGLRKKCSNAAKLPRVSAAVITIIAEITGGMLDAFPGLPEPSE